MFHKQNTVVNAKSIGSYQSNIVYFCFLKFLPIKTPLILLLRRNLNKRKHCFWFCFNITCREVFIAEKDYDVLLTPCLSRFKWPVVLFSVSPYGDLMGFRDSPAMFCSCHNFRRIIIIYINIYLFQIYQFNFDIVRRFSVLLRTFLCLFNSPSAPENGQRSHQINLLQEKILLAVPV